MGMNGRNRIYLADPQNPYSVFDDDDDDVGLNLSLVSPQIPISPFTAFPVLSLSYFHHSALLKYSILPHRSVLVT